jgi:hypothetical protein
MSDQQNPEPAEGAEVEPVSPVEGAPVEQSPSDPASQVDPASAEYREVAEGVQARSMTEDELGERSEATEESSEETDEEA